MNDDLKNEIDSYIIEKYGIDNFILYQTGCLSINDRFLNSIMVKRKFIIPVGDVSPKKAKKTLSEIRSNYNCTIPFNDSDYFIPLSNNPDL